MMFEHAPLAPAPQPEPPQKKKRGWLKWAGAVAILTLGFGMGATQQPKPVEKIVEKPVEKIVEKKVTVEKVPQVCLDALNSGSRGLELSTEATQSFVATLEAIQQGSVSGVNAQTAKVESIATRMKPVMSDWVLQRESCRSAAAK